MRSQEQEQERELASDRFNLALAKLRLVQAYVEQCAYRDAEDAAAVLQDALRDLNKVAGYVQCLRMRNV